MGQLGDLHVVLHTYHHPSIHTFYRLTSLLSPVQMGQLIDLHVVLHIFYPLSLHTFRLPFQYGLRNLNLRTLPQRHLRMPPHTFTLSFPHLHTFEQILLQTLLLQKNLSPIHTFHRYLLLHTIHLLLPPLLQHTTPLRVVLHTFQVRPRHSSHPTWGLHHPDLLQQKVIPYVCMYVCSVVIFFNVCMYAHYRNSIVDMSVWQILPG